jgi:hypothetical protein
MGGRRGEEGVDGRRQHDGQEDVDAAPRHHGRLPPLAAQIDARRRPPPHGFICSGHGRGHLRAAAKCASRSEPTGRSRLRAPLLHLEAPHRTRCEIQRGAGREGGAAPLLRRHGEQGREEAAAPLSLPRRSLGSNARTPWPERREPWMCRRGGVRMVGEGRCVGGEGAGG